ELERSVGWRGEGGLWLSVEQVVGVDAFLGLAVGAEPGITGVMAEIAGAVPRGELVGLEFRVKSAGSLKRKVATALLEDPNVDVAHVLAGLKDTVRFTLQVPDGHYVAGVEHAVGVLRGRGFEVVSFKNTWGSQGYQGINAAFREPGSGVVFELQFHTPASFEAKMGNHELYEQARLPGVDEATRADLAERMREAFDAVPRPDGAPQLTATPPTVDHGLG
ncbi:MAG: hypothetical protein ACRDQF_07000, partial [Thermocrispum sp.]